MPIGKADVVAANEEADHTVQKNPGLLQYVIVNPLQPRTFEQAHDMLARPKCVGIKIHPEAHCYPIAEHGEAIFTFAAEHEAVVLAHSGDENSWPADIVPLADAFPEASVILAHLGNGGRASGDPDLQVRALTSAKHDTVYIDTSSARSLIPGLIEWAVAEVGVERLLYGTDTLCYYAPCQWARIAYTDLSAKQERLILRDNGVKIFGLSD